MGSTPSAKFGIFTHAQKPNAHSIFFAKKTSQSHVFKFPAKRRKPWCAEAVPGLQDSKVAPFQSYMVPGIHNCKSPWFQSYKVSEFQGCRVPDFSRVPRLQCHRAKIPSFPRMGVSKVLGLMQDFKVSGFQGSRVCRSRFFRVSWSQDLMTHETNRQVKRRKMRFNKTKLKRDVQVLLKVLEDSCETSCKEAILWHLKGQYSRRSCEGFFPKNCCPPHFSLYLPNIHHPHLLCP